MEDRWTAIRWAIGTARDKDIVIIAGRGHTDFQEYIANGMIYRVRQATTCPPMHAPSALSVMPGGPREEYWMGGHHENAGLCCQGSALGLVVGEHPTRPGSVRERLEMVAGLWITPVAGAGVACEAAARSLSFQIGSSALDYPVIVSQHSDKTRRAAANDGL